MYDDAVRQSIIDDEHLKLLSLGYMVSAGISAFFSLFGLMYVFMGAMISRMPASQKSGPPPAFVGWLFAGIGLAFFLAMIALALLKFKVAKSIKQRRSRAFCLVLAGISCLGVPYGTVLGVFTFIVLGRESVARLFEPRTPSPPAA
jgi:divalent metal cation (Fe/Co/Zn/Cd) transporter